jgi:hypothetical protein
MPAVNSKAYCEQQKKRPAVYCTDKVTNLLDALGVPSACKYCPQSCDACMLSCECPRCSSRRTIDPESADKARIAIVQTAKKYVQMDPKQKKKIIYSEVKQCIYKVTKKGHYRFRYFLGEAADQITVCKKAFDKFHAIDHTYVDRLVVYHKKKVIAFPIFIFVSNFCGRVSDLLQTFMRVIVSKPTRCDDWRYWRRSSRYS